MQAIACGREDDLLLEIVKSWETVKKRSASGVYWLPLKPLVVAPLIPPERRNQLLVEEHMQTLERMGAELIDDPTSEEILEVDAMAAYVEHVVEHVRHAILKAQGLLQPQPTHVDPSASKRRRLMNR